MRERRATSRAPTRGCIRRRVLAALAGLVALAGVPSPALAHRPKASFFGMLAPDLPAGFPAAARRRHELRAIRRSGAGAIRVTFDVRMPRVVLDNLVLDAARHRVKVLPMLINGRGYVVARGSRHGLPAPRRFTALARRAGRMAARYGPHGTLWRHHKRLRRYAVDTWQVWNEPNLPVFWHPRPNPWAYARMVKAVGRAIRRHEHHATIVSAGLPDSTQSWPRNYRQYLTAFLKAGGGRYVTAVGVHAYSHSVGQFVATLRTVRRILDRHHGRRIKMLITEVGWADAGYPNPHVVGRTGQSRVITGAYRAVGRLRHRWHIAGIYYYKWRDSRVRRGDPRGNTWGYHTGLLRVNGRPKPALKAFERALRRMR